MLAVKISRQYVRLVNVQRWGILLDIRFDVIDIATVKTLFVSALAGISFHGYGNLLGIEVPHHVDEVADVLSP